MGSLTCECRTDSASVELHSQNYDLRYGEIPRSHAGNTVLRSENRRALLLLLKRMLLRVALDVRAEVLTLRLRRHERGAIVLGHIGVVINTAGAAVRHGERVGRWVVSMRGNLRTCTRHHDDLWHVHASSFARSTSGNLSQSSCVFGTGAVATALFPA